MCGDRVSVEVKDCPCMWMDIVWNTHSHIIIHSQIYDLCFVLLFLTPHSEKNIE